MTEQAMERIARVQRIGQMGPHAFRNYLVDVRTAARRKAPMERLEMLAARLDVLETRTAEIEKREDELAEE